MKKMMMYWKERLFDARERVEGLHEDVYLIADYMFAIISPNALSPQGLALCFSEALDIMRKEVPKKLQGAVYFPQLIDVLCDEAYAEEFRELLREAYGFNPPKRYTEIEIEELPEFIKVAVDWWTNAITSRGCNEHIPRKLYQYVASQNYTKEQIVTYKKALAQKISKGLKAHTDVKLYVENWACPELEDAGRTIGVDPMIGYPWNTFMLISAKEVKVLDEHHEGIWETLWKM